MGARPLAAASGLAWHGPSPAEAFPFPAPDPELRPGSNAFALAGQLSAAGGAALVANDMHLGLAVPPIWYRASLTFAGRTLTGVTLPGTPFVVAGSNGEIAWGFTNAQVDSGDLIAVETNSLAPNLYKAPGHGEDFLRIERRRETTAVRVLSLLPICPLRRSSTLCWSFFIAASKSHRQRLGKVARVSVRSAKCDPD